MALSTAQGHRLMMIKVEVLEALKHPEEAQDLLEEVLDQDKDNPLAKSQGSPGSSGCRAIKKQPSMRIAKCRAR